MVTGFSKDTGPTARGPIGPGSCKLQATSDSSIRFRVRESLAHSTQLKIFVGLERAASNSRCVWWRRAPLPAFSLAQYIRNACSFKSLGVMFLLECLLAP